MMAARRTRIFIVDDSPVMRSLLRSVAAADPSLVVAGTAADGATALEAIEELRPDVVLLDVEMPVVDGVVTVRTLRERGHRMPVIMCSSLTHRGARVTIEALAAGATDYVAKPKQQSSAVEAARALAGDLLPKIHALASHSINPLVAPQEPSGTNGLSTPSIVVIGVSTGGPAALDVLLPALPATFALPVLVVQHMPEAFTRLLAERLNAACRLEVREASEGDVIRPGIVSVARGGRHLEVRAAGAAPKPPRLHLTEAEPENHCRPAVDVLFRSAAAAFGAGVLAVVLTGMGSDGVAGARIVRACGGTVLAQDQATSAVWGMPGAVTNARLAHRVLPIEAMAGEIVRLTRRTLAVDQAKNHPAVGAI